MDNNGQMMGAAPMDPNQNPVSTTPQNNTFPADGGVPQAAAPAPASKGNKTTLIIIIIVAAVLITVGIILAIILSSSNSDSGSSDKTDTSKTSDDKEKPVNTGNDDNKELSDDELKENIKFTYEKTNKGDLVVFAKNNNTVPVSLSFTVDVYDADDNAIGYTAHGSYDPIAAGEEIVRTISVYPSKMDHYKLDYTVSKKYYNANSRESIEISSEKFMDEFKVGGVKVKVKNISDKTVNTTNLTVLFYKDGKIEGFSDTTAGKLEAGDSKEIELRRPLNSNAKYIDYDDYKVYYYSYSYAN